MKENSAGETEINIPEYVSKLDLRDYTYDLPENRIAQYPLSERDKSKLLVSVNNKITSTVFSHLPDYINPNQLLVFNDSRVVRARMLFQKDTGANIEIFCLEPVAPADYEKSFSSSDAVIWKCMIGNLKKWKNELLSRKFIHDNKEYHLTAEKISTEGDTCEVKFSWNNNDLFFSEILELTGHVPLPPYISRADNEQDAGRYQTIYASNKGSVAAPTAGLHFTDSVMDRLRKKGVNKCELTLHVGAGTFQPVKTQKVFRHKMHGEHIIIDRKTINDIAEAKGKVIAVGTTSVRSLESLYWLGAKIISRELSDPSNIEIDQWYPYSSGKDYPSEKSLDAVLGYMDRCNIESFRFATRLMIVPGYQFRIVNGMITNFHQPGSTLLLLVAAWCGEHWKEIYGFAMKNNYRFLSYGDSTLIIK
jgi:S-adenosylmethionine:tRNA ribosyltransferase-isomerase